MNARYHAALVIVFATSLLAGCRLAHPGKLLKQATGRQPIVSLQVSVSLDANNNDDVPFDVAIIRDKALLKQISQMDSAAWFAAPPKGRCVYRGSAKSKAQFLSWELVQGQTYRIDVPVDTSTKALFGFVGYSAPGEHRVSIVTNGSEALDLDKTGVTANTKNVVLKPTLPAKTRPKVCPDE